MKESWSEDKFINVIGLEGQNQLSGKPTHGWIKFRGLG
jgi:hypothetical protein